MSQKIRYGFTGKCPLCGQGGHVPNKDEFKKIAFLHFKIDHKMDPSQAEEMVKKIIREGALRKDPMIGYFKKHTLELQPVKTEGFILDIGGGGEGIIGRLMGKKVTAIDINPGELEGARHRETDKESLKIIMDASDLKFLPESFDFVTSFFSLMYIENNKHQKVIDEIFRVLKGDGRFLIWDVVIPEKTDGALKINLPLEIILQGDKIDTNYMVEWDTQDIDNFKGLAKQSGFNIVGEWANCDIYFLELLKKPPIVPEVTVAGIDKLVEDHPLVVIDFWGPLCAPCVEMVPLIEELAREYAGKCVFRKLNLSNVWDLVIEKYNVRIVPALLFFKNGKLVDRIDDPYPEKTPTSYARACVKLIREIIERYL